MLSTSTNLFIHTRPDVGKWVYVFLNTIGTYLWGKYWISATTDTLILSHPDPGQGCSSSPQLVVSCESTNKALYSRLTQCKGFTQVLYPRWLVTGSLPTRSSPHSWFTYASQYAQGTSWAEYRVFPCPLSQSLALSVPNWVLLRTWRFQVYLPPATWSNFDCSLTAIVRKWSYVQVVILAKLLTGRDHWQWLSRCQLVLYNC